jgi:hypothetical protein
MVRANLVIPTQPPRLGQPAEGSFDQPALRQDLETFALVRPPHNFQVKLAERAECLYPLQQGSKIAAVGPAI